VTGSLPAARRSYYSGTLAEFCAADRDEIFARMARQTDFDLNRNPARRVAATGRRLRTRSRAPWRLDLSGVHDPKPTPTIIGATLALYRGHSVTELSWSDAGATNLSATAEIVASTIAATKARSEKATCFVTGVPGAGKTLVGLDVVLSRNPSCARKIREDVAAPGRTGANRWARCPALD
jgi:hypothetical protein